MLVCSRPSVFALFSSIVVSFCGLQLAGCKTRVYFNDFEGKKGSFLSKKSRLVSHTNLKFKELSGVARWRGALCSEPNCIAAIGDGSHSVVTAQLVRGDSGFQAMSPNQADAARVSKGEASQWEAITSDTLGRVYVLSERERRVLVFDKDLQRVLTTIQLNVSEDRELGDGGDVPAGIGGSSAAAAQSGCEGIVLLANNHLLVAFEKEPMVLVEFGPSRDKPVGLKVPNTQDVPRDFVAGDTLQYEALRYWQPDKGAKKALQDISDLAVYDGEIYVLSDQSKVIARLKEAKNHHGQFGVSDIWKLSDLQGKPEGLAFLDDGSPIVVVDSKNEDEENLFVFESVSKN
jgi:SdiA-regulated